MKHTPDESGELAKTLASQIPLWRWGEASEIAKAVLFLSSEDASYVQGVELFVDSGMTASPFGGPAFRS